jgi:hypothetical protein
VPGAVRGLRLTNTCSIIAGVARAEAFAGDPVIGGADPTGPERVRGWGGAAGKGAPAAGVAGTAVVAGGGRAVGAAGVARIPWTAGAAGGAGGAGGAVAAVSRVPAVEVGPTELARDRSLPVLPALEALLPGAGLRRGTTVAVGSAPGVAGATSLALALAAGASQAGSWVAGVGLGSLGLVATAELGVALERLVLVADPGRDREGWATVVGALVDGFDVVLVSSLGRLRPPDARRLVARVRERGAVLVAVGGDLPGERSPLRLTVTAARWEGLGEGWGHLEGRRVTVEAGGRGDATRLRRAELWLPAEGGGVTGIEPVAPPVPLRSAQWR